MITADVTGNFTRMGNGWIETSGGKPFNILAPEITSIHADEIAHALSLLCRYNGHCTSFYSVAQHCCYVYDWMLAKRHPPKLALIGLLHDGSEAYVGDVVRPLKPLLPDYLRIEHRIQSAIYERYGLLAVAEANEGIIKEADNAVLKAEAQQLMRSKGRGWSLEGIEAATFRIDPWSPKTACAKFLERFHGYYDGVLCSHE